jgi:hypothetical protein
MLSDHPRKVNIRLIKSVKIEDENNMKLTYQPLPSKQSNES